MLVGAAPFVAVVAPSCVFAGRRGVCARGLRRLATGCDGVQANCWDATRDVDESGAQAPRLHRRAAQSWEPPEGDGGGEEATLMSLESTSQSRRLLRSSRALADNSSRGMRGKASRRRRRCPRTSSSLPLLPSCERTVLGPRCLHMNRQRFVCASRQTLMSTAVLSRWD